MCFRYVHTRAIYRGYVTLRGKSFDDCDLSFSVELRSRKLAAVVSVNSGNRNVFHTDTRYA